MRYLLGSFASLVMLSAVASQDDDLGAGTVLDASKDASSSPVKEADAAPDDYCSHADLESDFERERDDAWADGAEAMLYFQIAQVPDLQLTSFSVQCQSNVCRLRFAFPTDEYQHEYGNTLVADAIDSAPGFLRNFGKIVPGAQGSPTMEYYLMREGVCATRPVK